MCFVCDFENKLIIGCMGWFYLFCRFGGVNLECCNNKEIEGLLYVKIFLRVDYEKILLIDW